MVWVRLHAVLFNPAVVANFRAMPVEYKEQQLRAVVGVHGYHCWRQWALQTSHDGIGGVHG